MPDDVVVQTEELSKKFGDFIAVDRVSFEVRRGEVVGYLGPNGAGKTTTILGKPHFLRRCVRYARPCAPA
ncbi:MAG: ATP-binding cassette domain-containing protein [Anaerolineales bacterium]